MVDSYLSILTTPQQVKKVKAVLENNHKLDRSQRIQTTKANPPTSWIPTTISVPHEPAEIERLLTDTLVWLKEAVQQQQPDFLRLKIEHRELNNHVCERNPLQRANQPEMLRRRLRQWLSRCSELILSSRSVDVDELCTSFPTSYTIYPPMLLLPKGGLTSSPWAEFYPLLDSTLISSLWTYILDGFTMPLSIVAFQGPIPLKGRDGTSVNILRSPTQLQALFGYLGTFVTASPTVRDFADAIWVHTIQNGVHQTWAPLYTMFSRGNIKEKARILDLPSLSGRSLREQPITAVDLYAGIGYFTFSYAKAGVGKILCWDLNPWSVEALIRGAKGNNLTIEARLSEEDLREEVINDSEQRIMVYLEDNQRALGRINASRKNFPPIRHVNCGMLPTSELIWSAAVQMIDPVFGGWIHAHENIVLKLEEHRVQTITASMQAFAGQERRVLCDHVERVKSYAPGVMHCVVDIFIGPEPGAAMDAHHAHDTI